MGKKAKIKILDSQFKFIWFCLSQSLLHPRRRIEYYICDKCHTRFVSEEGICPKCRQSSPNPVNRRSLSPTPWYGSAVLSLAGAVCIGIGSKFEAAALSEVGRAMIYIPLGHLYGRAAKE